MNTVIACHCIKKKDWSNNDHDRAVIVVWFWDDSFAPLVSAIYTMLVGLPPWSLSSKVRSLGGKSAFALVLYRAQKDTEMRQGSPPQRDVKWATGRGVSQAQSITSFKRTIDFEWFGKIFIRNLHLPLLHPFCKSAVKLYSRYRLARTKNARASNNKLHSKMAKKNMHSVVFIFSSFEDGNCRAPLTIWGIDLNQKQYPAGSHVPRASGEASASSLNLLLWFASSKTSSTLSDGEALIRDSSHVFSGFQTKPKRNNTIIHYHIVSCISCMVSYIYIYI